MTEKGKSFQLKFDDEIEEEDEDELSEEGVSFSDNNEFVREKVSKAHSMNM